MLTIIERYILRRASVIFAAAMISTLAIAWTTQVLKRINLVTDTGQSAAAFLELATLILPSVIPEILPFAMAIGIAQTLTAMNTDSELVVVNASGGPRTLIARPVILLALVGCILAFFVQNVVEPYSRSRVRELVSEARAGLISSVIQEGAFSRIEDGLFLQVGSRNADGTLGSIVVVDNRQKDIDLLYYAKTGVLGERDGTNFLSMRDGEIHRNKPGEAISIVRFTSYIFDLAEFSAVPKTVNLWPKDRSLSYLLNPDPNDKFLKSHPGMFTAEIHKRLSTWLNPLAFALVALAIAGNARSHREARLHPMVSTMMIVLFVRWLGYFSFGKSDTSAFFGMMLYVVPLATSLIALYVFSSARKVGLPARQAEWLQDRSDAMRGAIASLPHRLAVLSPLRGGRAQ